MFKIFGAIIAAVILYFIWIEYRKGVKEEKKTEELDGVYNERMEEAEDRLTDVLVDSQVLNVEETIARKEQENAERVVKLKSNNRKEAE